MPATRSRGGSDPLFGGSASGPSALTGPIGRNVLIIGAPGSGKSTLARTLGDRLGLRVIHFDQLFWRPDWTSRASEDLPAIVEEAIRDDGWVFDGNNSRTLAQRATRADTLIWLDLPRAICMARILKRTALSYGRVRSDMADGCPERFDSTFLRWTWTFHSHSRPAQAEFFRSTPIPSKHRLTSPAEVRRFLARLARASPLPPSGERLGGARSDRT